MNPPANPDLPFFAYGLFRPGQIAFFQIRELVEETQARARVHGDLWVRDGIPLLDPAGYGQIEGALLRFVNGRSPEAYERIASLNLDKQYRWGTATAVWGEANVLVGRSVRKGSDPMEAPQWDAWQDPLLTSALDVVKETMAESSDFTFDLKPLFRLQMAYLLLWSAIERYASLRYDLGKDVLRKVRQLASEEAFAESLRRRVKAPRAVQRADEPGDRQRLDPDDPNRSIDFYYQVRSNIVHRGKAAFRDHEILRVSLSELLPIVRDVLKAARADAKRAIG